MTTKKSDKRVWIKLITKTIVIILAPPVLILSLFWFSALQRESKDRNEVTAGKFVQAEDVEIHYEDFGRRSDPSIILIGGTGAWSGLWRETASKLSQFGYRVLSIDVPPFGYSETPLDYSYGNEAQAKRIIAFMDTLKIERAVLLGHSFGGGATVETALTIPDKIEKLILLDVGGLNFNNDASETTPSLLRLFLNSPFVRDPILSATATNPLLTKKLISSMVHDSKDIDENIIKILQEPLSLKGSTNTYGEWLKFVLTESESSQTEDPDNYKKLVMPTIVIWGDKDRIIPINEGKYLNSLIPNSQFVVMNDVNHIPHIEDFNKLIEIVTNFLKNKN